MASLAEQLTDIYLNEEDYYAQSEKMSREEAQAHHEAMLRAGQIITVADHGVLAGYVEFSMHHGCCFINDLFIRPAYRRGRVIWMLKKRLMELCGPGRVLLGERNKFGTRYPEFKLRKQRSLDG